MTTEHASRTPRLSATLRTGGRVMPLELFFDLVFVLALTQCTALMAHEPTWEGLCKGLLVLGILWWAWVGYAWLTSVVDPEEGGVRLALIAAMAAMLVCALAIPEAFEDYGLLFAGGLAVVRIAQIVLFVIASQGDPGLRKSVTGLAMSTALGVGIIAAASFTDGALQGGLWVLALALDMGGPALFGAEGWKLEPEHFAERHGLIIIIALGESIVAIGVGAEGGLTWAASWRPSSGSSSPPRSGGCTSTSWRSSRPGGWRTPRPAGSATRSRATPSPSCTCR